MKRIAELWYKEISLKWFMIISVVGGLVLAGLSLLLVWWLTH